MLRVGLTGGIACGKSRVLRRLVARGCHGLDLDEAARRLTVPGTSAAAEIVAAFGSGVVGAQGSLDRRALGALVFSDAGARRRLEAILHPRLRQAELEWAAGVVEPDGVVVTDGAVLIEAGAHLRFDRLVVVHCEPRLQLRRLRERDGLDEAAARARLVAQMAAAEKRAFAHLEVDSSGTVEETDRAADAVFEELSRAASLRGPAAAAGEAPLRRLLGGLAHAGTSGPRGLTPGGLLAFLAESGDLDLGLLAGRLSPPSDGPWYHAAEEAPPLARASALSAALVAWNVLRRRADPEVLIAAAASLARLTHTLALERADACLLALLLRQVVVEGASLPDLPALAKGHLGSVGRWGGAEPSPALWSSISAAAACPQRPASARREAEEQGGDASAAAVLVGAALGADRASTPGDLREAVASLGGG